MSKCSSLDNSSSNYRTTLFGSVVSSLLECKMFLQAIMCVMAVHGAVSGPLFANNKLSLADWGSYSHRDHKGPGTYAYGYDIEDPVTGNVQFKQEERHLNGTVTGSYGYIEPNGNPRVLYYISDHNGYRVRIENVIEKDPDISNFPQNVIQQDELLRPVETPSRVQIPPPIAAQPNVINDHFGNDITANIPQTSPSFDQQRLSIRNPVRVYYSSPIVYRVRGGAPVLAYSNAAGFVRASPSAFFKL